MKAMIFAAGLGTRFKPWTLHHPKALALVNGKSLLQRNIEYLQRYGINEVVVNVHHYADQLIEEIENQKGWGSTVIISDEQNAVLETGGGLLHAQKWLDDGQPFITLNADILTDAPIDSLIDFHHDNKALISFAMSNRKSSRCFLFDEHNRLCGWQHMETGETKIARPSENLHPMAYNCVVVFGKDFYAQLIQKGKFSLTEAYLSLAANHRIMGFDVTGSRFIDVGKPESVAIAEALFE